MSPLAVMISPGIIAAHTDRSAGSTGGAGKAAKAQADTETGSDANDMEKRGGGGEAGHIVKPASIFRHFGAMGMAMEATVPGTHRWIPKGMTVQYLAKATTSLRARAEFTPPDFAAITEGAELVVPVSITDRNGAEVVHADITTWVTPAG